VLWLALAKERIGYVLTSSPSKRNLTARDVIAASALRCSFSRIRLAAACAGEGRLAMSSMIRLYMPLISEVRSWVS
jgi:hypothetical protein